MKLIDNLVLRKLLRSMDRIADADERIAQVLEDLWAKDHAPRVRKKAEFGEMDVEELNRLYNLRREAEKEGIELEEEE